MDLVPMIRDALRGRGRAVELPGDKSGWSVRFSAGGHIEALCDGKRMAWLDIETFSAHSGELFIVTNLDGVGDAYAIRILAAMLRGLFGETGFYLGVHFDNPKHDRLVRAYERIMGAREVMTLMHVTGKTPVTEQMEDGE